jgi:tetratricopeptide (TPR) repeat protein
MIIQKNLGTGLASILITLTDRSLALAVASLVAALTLITAGSHGAFAQDVEPEAQSVPAFQSPDIDTGLGGETALADCKLARAFLEKEINLQVILMLDACAEEITNLKAQAEYLHLRGWVYETIGVLDRASSDYKRASGLEPQRIEYKLDYGLALLATKDNEAAMPVIKAALRLDPSDANALAAMGKAHYKRGSLSPARAFLDRALAVEPNHISARLDRGLTLLHKKTPVQAKQDFDKVLALDPTNVDALHYRGLAHHQAGDLEAALNDFDAAIGLAPNSPQILSNRGAILALLDRKALALEDFNLALEISPFSADALYGRGLLRARTAGRNREKVQAAKADLQQAITIDPSNDQLGAAMKVLNPEN